MSNVYQQGSAVAAVEKRMMYRLHTSADLVRYAQSLERRGMVFDRRQMRADWEAAQVHKFWVRFDLAASIAIASCSISLTIAMLWAGAVLIAGFLSYVDLFDRIYV